MKRLFLLISYLSFVGYVFGQKLMTAPTVMVVPDMTYCATNQYTQQFNNNGITETIPDYEKALATDPTLNQCLTQIAQLIKERNSSIVTRDLSEVINLAKTDAAMAVANAGDESESIDEAIIRNSNADILVKVYYDIAKNGPQYFVNFVLNGVDAYTGEVFAPLSGVGAPSTSANPILLLREAVYSHMDKFLASMLTHYNEMVKKGRMVAFDIKITSTSGVNMNSKVGQYTLKEVIDDFLYDNSVDGAGLERVRIGNTFLQYDGIFIPLTSTSRGRQRRIGAQEVAQRLVNFLEEKGISAEFKARGIGKVNIYIK